MPYVPLLERQIKKYLKEEIPPDFIPLLDAINNSYQHYERDHALGIKSLEISSRELQQLAEDNEAKKERLKAIQNSASDGILVLNEKGIIQECNNAALKYFGYSSSNDIVGKNINIIPVRTNCEGILLFNLLDQTSSKKLYELEILKKTKPLFVEFSVSELFLKSEKLKICIMRDITERKMHEKMSELRHSITHLLTNSSSLNESIPIILQKLCNELEWDAAVFWESGLTPAYSYNPKNLNLNLQERVEPFHFEKENIIREKHTSFKSVDLIPIHFETELLGTIQLFSTIEKKEEFEEQIKIDIASEIALFIEKELIRKRELKLQQELVVSAKQVGMMQVANSVLHNVGNVLNSVNISAALLRDELHQSELNNLSKIAQMIRDHKDHIAKFINEDPKGKLIPDYIIEVSEKWKEELNNHLNEVKIIIDNIQNIKNLIKTQLSPEESSSAIERVDIKKLIDEILELKQSELKSGKITVIRDYDLSIECLVDKSRLNQVIVNILNNAIEATETNPNREIRIQLEKRDSTFVIHFIDNGIGLDLSELEKLFSYGFTTKKTGHGFGLHTSLKQIQDMGGEIKASSQGKTKGADFSIQLPLLESHGLLK